MKKIVECVPNFSEGGDSSVLNAISAEISMVPDVVLLDVDPGKATNRAVFTFVGPPNSVAEAAFRAIQRAADLIDMRKHRGEHPRMGATDVCPFVPVSNVTMEECVEIARKVGERVGRELKIPVYLYEKAASKPNRRSLANIREGEYEGLEKKLADPEWSPDFGPAEFKARSGATAVGAREFLIAYNVNLNTRDKKLAHEIALRIRETGRTQKTNGEKIHVPGLLPGVRAVGWTIAEYGCAQVSINLLDYHVTPPHIAFETCREEAKKLGLRVTGSELVGLIPKEALLMAGRYYLDKQGKSPGLPESELAHIAIRSLGLSELSPFDVRQKVIEYKISAGKESLMELTTRAFIDEVSSDSPAPGGGSVAALCGALSAALGAMVANLTVGKKGLESNWNAMKSSAVMGQELKEWFMDAVDEDAAAFNRVMEAFRKPGKSPEEKKIKEQQVGQATKEATEVPLRVLEHSLRVLGVVAEVAQKGNPNSLSDAGVAALCARTCAEGAYLNVLINLSSLKDAAWVDTTRRKATSLRSEVVEKSTRIVSDIERRIL
ncbi:MAG TPA: glutamate formimidoyltransferase [Bdellovibrionota bacterium]|nr:glutamate formimidoyltransferase [Bdellovibrionota bacterium]